MNLSQTDPDIYNLIKQEEERQQFKLSMIPSENFFSKSVREAIGSVLMHKYSEGNIGKRYYEGNEFIDQIEQLAIDRAKKAFNLPEDWDVNMQALAGSNANLAVYLALLNIGDTMMGMYLPDGGHLSHGWSYEPDKTKRVSDENVYLGGSSKVHISSKIYKTVQYKVDPKTEQFDYDEVAKLVQEHKPKLLITGGTAYPRNIDYKKIREIADSVSAYYMADIAHEAGLIAAGVVPSPIGVAHVVTLTTHKTLRSGRGAMILSTKEIIEKVNRAILPGLQGGPFDNNIAGIAVGLGEALKPEFKNYAAQVVKNAQLLAQELEKLGFRIVSGGTDKHLVLIDLTAKGVFGKYSARALNHAGIVLNMNTRPGDVRPPSDPSAIRLGTPWVTTRGMKEAEMKQIAVWINTVIDQIKQYANLDFAEFEKKLLADEVIKKTAQEVKELCLKFPLEI